ncbi:2'-5' RNA ligase family protein [Proteiniborus sp. MB09-C3]|uniref:2'-5' RNA ligase family protein n=1 Tax=Proteiniborus sp. MB09-C3 TaxID=3050072 RepID=UPI0025569D4F|nr:2'-5' RNA ligase family protein [Proteiniborus sp. MB09-C3]WIV12739.1 2'-5' RNA ligase family protein [Proteiniborus sp. MB09-C3]
MNTNIKKRCIMLFPQFENINIIDYIREKYDPLSSHVRPHITLVFPFESTLSKEDLEDYLKTSLEEIKCFNLSLEEVVKIDNSLGLYLFLRTKEGTEKIKELHNKLYEGMLNIYKPEWLNNGHFIPHMTIGTFNNREELNNAYAEVSAIEYKFSTLVERISVGIIDENEDSIIEMEVDLNKQ